jgi:hypothetical protein
MPYAQTGDQPRAREALKKALGISEIFRLPQKQEAC